MRKIVFLVFLLLICIFNLARAEELKDEVKRFQSLTQEIRCVVCQNQNIADSNAPLANDLREKVYKMIVEKKSNEEIKDYLVKRYGEFILLQPRFNKTTFLLWIFPFVAVMIVLVSIIAVSKD